MVLEISCQLVVMAKVGVGSVAWSVVERRFIDTLWAKLARTFALAV